MDTIRHYDVTITGTTPLLLHADNIAWSDSLRKWREDPTIKKTQVRGDDRSPAWTWIGNIYSDNTNLVMPADNISRCVMEGATMVAVPGGKSGKTFKAQSQSGMMIVGDWPLYISGKSVALAPIEALIGNANFDDHMASIEKLGFSLYVKRAKIGQQKHVRVRPRFINWSCRGTVRVLDPAITISVLENILQLAGAYKGIGDWRPSSKTPGSYGMFTAEITAI